MKYTEKEKKALEFLINKRDEAYGLMQFEDGELYQLAEEEFNNYLTIEEIIDKQQKEIEELKYKYKKYGKVLFTEDAIKENYVSKNEIREKIKTFKNIPNYGIFQSKEPIIRVLTELLGDE